MPSPFDPLLVPPRLLLRALDDLHAIAGVAREGLDVLTRLEQRAERVEGEIKAMLALGARVIELGEQIDARAHGMLELGGRIDQRAEALLDLGHDIAELGGTILVEGKSIQARAHEVAVQGANVAAAIPTLQRAVELTEPLEGAVERLGRIVDRLPGGAASRRRAATRPKPD